MFILQNNCIVFMLLFYMISVGRFDALIDAHSNEHPSDYYDFDNARNNDMYPYYGVQDKQFEQNDLIFEDVAEASLVLGGAALFGVIGIIGIAVFQEINANKLGQSTCCDACTEIQKQTKDIEVKMAQLEEKNMQLAEDLKNKETELDSFNPFLMRLNNTLNDLDTAHNTLQGQQMSICTTAMQLEQVIKRPGDAEEIDENANDAIVVESIRTTLNKLFEDLRRIGVPPLVCPP